MKTNLFSLATVVLAAVASVVSMSSCNKSDDPQVIDDPTPKEVSRTENFTCVLAETFQQMDITATTKDGKSYTITAGDKVADNKTVELSGLTDEFAKNPTFSKMKAENFQSTISYTPVTITFKKKANVTLPETIDFIVSYSKETITAEPAPFSPQALIAVFYPGIYSNELDNFIEILEQSFPKKSKLYLRKDGVLVFL